MIKMRCIIRKDQRTFKLFIWADSVRVWLHTAGGFQHSTDRPRLGEMVTCLFICFSFLAPGLQGNTSPTQAQEQRHHSVRYTQKGKQFLQKYLGKVIRQMDYYGLQQSKQQTLGRGESDLQSYHILMFKCPVFNNDKKKSHSVQKQESTAHLKE